MPSAVEISEFAEFTEPDAMAIARLVSQLSTSAVRTRDELAAIAQTQGTLLFTARYADGSIVRMSTLSGSASGGVTPRSFRHTIDTTQRAEGSKR